MGTSHRDEVRDRVGVYYKYSSKDYRAECLKDCQGGYHAHWWEAHHILPGVVFANVTGFPKLCLGVTDYNINKPYSMCGLPQMNAFILYFQFDPKMPYQEESEKLKHMERWGKVGEVKALAKKGVAVTCPNVPIHNPVSFGHTKYNEEVSKYLEEEIWSGLKEEKKKNRHFKPQDVLESLEEARDEFWTRLRNRPTVPGGNGIVGIKENLEKRYNETKDGWWKPLCMTDVEEEPVSR